MIIEIELTCPIHEWDSPECRDARAGTIYESDGLDLFLTVQQHGWNPLEGLKLSTRMVERGIYAARHIVLGKSDLELAVYHKNAIRIRAIKPACQYRKRRCESN